MQTQRTERPEKKTVPYYSPSRAFEMATGLSDVSSSYILPDGLSPIHLDTILFEYEGGTIPAPWKDVFQQYAAKIRRLNPCLRKVRFDPIKDNHLVWFLRGVASSFNPDDIDYFLNTDKEEKEKDMRGPLRQRVETRLRQLFEGCNGFSWLPSPETLEHVQRQLSGYHMR